MQGAYLLPPYLAQLRAGGAGVLVLGRLASEGAVARGGGGVCLCVDAWIASLFVAGEGKPSLLEGMLLKACVSSG